MREPTVGFGMMGAPSESWQTAFLAQLAGDVGEGSDAFRFLAVALRVSATTGNVRLLAHELAINEQTLTSRFFRAGLPSPKDYLQGFRLVQMAVLWEDAARTLSSVAYDLQCSSPQGMGRIVRRELGISAAVARHEFGAERMREFFRRRLVLHYRAKLQIADLLVADLRVTRARRKARAAEIACGALAKTDYTRAIGMRVVEQPGMPADAIAFCGADGRVKGCIVNVETA